MTTLAHARAGAGRRPVVLLHGLLGSGRNLATLGRSLVADNSDLALVSFDLTGHGASPPLPPGADTAALAADVLDSARALALPPPLALVGHSLGGRVALRAALSEPAMVEGVVLLDVAPGPLTERGDVADVLDIVLRLPDSFASRARARAELEGAGLSSALAEWLLLNLTAAGEGYRWRVDRRALADLHRRVAAEDLWPGVERPRSWTLRCVRGATSPYVTANDVQRLAAAGCPVTAIEGAGHFLHVDQPGAVAAAVRAALV